MSTNLYRYITIDAGAFRKEYLDQIQDILLVNGWAVYEDQCTVDYSVGVRTLTAGITSSSLTIPVTDTSGFPDVGIIHIGTERIRYTSKNATNFYVGTTANRGIFRTTAQNHSSGADYRSGYFRIFRTERTVKPIYPGGPSNSNDREMLMVVYVDTTVTHIWLMVSWDTAAKNGVFPYIRTPFSSLFVGAGSTITSSTNDFTNGMMVWLYCSPDFFFMRNKTAVGNQTLIGVGTVQRVLLDHINVLPSYCSNGVHFMGSSSSADIIRWSPLGYDTMTTVSLLPSFAISYKENVIFPWKTEQMIAWKVFAINAAGYSISPMSLLITGEVMGFVYAPHITIIGASIPDEAECLISDVDTTFTTLTLSMSAVDTVANVVDTSAFPTNGRLIIDGEGMNYYGKTATQFQNLERGRWGTTAATHSVNSRVYRGRRAKLHDIAATPHFVMFMEY